MHIYKKQHIHLHIPRSRQPAKRSITTHRAIDSDSLRGEWGLIRAANAGSKIGTPTSVTTDRSVRRSAAFDVALRSSRTAAVRSAKHDLVRLPRRTDMIIMDNQQQRQDQHVVSTRKVVLDFALLMCGEVMFFVYCDAQGDLVNGYLCRVGFVDLGQIGGISKKACFQIVKIECLNMGKVLKR